MRSLAYGILVATIMASAGIAHAYTHNACFQMPYQGYFTDDDVGEDHHGGWYRPRGMQVVIRTTGGSTVFSGNLSSQGCVSFDDGRPAGTAYNITYTSRVTFSNGDTVTVYGKTVPGDPLSAPGSKSNTDTFVKTSSAEASYQFPIASGAPNPRGEHKVATLFSFAASRGWRGKPSTRVYLDVDGAGGGDCTVQDGRISASSGATCCTDGSICTIEIGADLVRSKFTIMHEFGHAVAHRITDTGRWTGGANDCSLTPVDDMESEEYMGCAANEGFADYVSTAIFNDVAIDGMYARRGVEYGMLENWHQCDDDYYGGNDGRCIELGRGTRGGWMRAWWQYARSVDRENLEDELACAYNWGRHDLIDNMQDCSSNLAWFNAVIGWVGP